MKKTHYYLGFLVAFLLAVPAALLFAAEAPTINAGILNAANATTTSAAVGTSLHARAYVSTASSTLPVPSGTVDFTRYDNTSCTGTGTTQTGVALANGMAESSAVALTASGLSYIVHYNGQGDVFTTGNSSCVSVTPTSGIVTVSGTLSTTSAQVGTTVHESSTLANATANAGGTVSYAVYTNAACSTGLIGAGVKTVTNGVVPDSNDIQFNNAGTFYWQAVYSGDSNNNAATSSCSPVLTITPIATAKGHIIVDKLTSPANDPASFSFTTTGSGYGAFSLTDLATPNNQELVVGTYTVSESSQSGWTLTSAGCSTNGAATTTYSPGTNITLSANDVVRCLFVNTKQPTTTPGSGSISGKSFNDLNKSRAMDSGEPGLSGWKINLFKNAAWWKFGNPVQTVITTADGSYSFVGLADGTYSVEQVITNGWNQISSDYKQIEIVNGAQITGRDFANVEKNNNGNAIGHNKDKNDKWKKFFKRWHSNGWRWGNDD